MIERPDRRIVLRRAEGLEESLNRLRGGTLAVDTETPGLKWWVDRPIGALNLAARRTSVVAIEEALGPAMRWLSDEVKAKRELVFHNAKFDMHMMRAGHGLHIPYPVHDTAVESFLLDNRGAQAYGYVGKSRHGLKPLASVFIDPDVDNETALMAAIRSRGGKHKGDWAILLGTEDEHLFTKYAGFDPWYTLKLHELFITMINCWTQPTDREYPSLRSLYETERWMILAFRDMEERGIMVHRDFLEQWRDQLAIKLKKQQERVFKLMKKEINLNSPPQIREVLYSKRKHGGMGLQTMRRTAGEEMSTDEVALLTLGHEVGLAIVEYRESQKQFTAYANGLLEWIAPDGAIHASFRSTGAGTGRTSCADPNLQQQTRESGVRKAYHPRQGLEFRFADYSQVEMRFAGHLSGEPSLIKGFNNDPDFDVHRSTAQVMYSRREPSERQRKFGKILNFTTLFGGGKGKIAEQLRERMKLPEVLEALREMKYKPQPGESPFDALASLLKDRYDAMLPSMKKATRKAADRAEAYGLIMNLFGQHRFLEDDRWYSAFNTEVQGTAGQKAKEGMVAVYKECQLNRGELALLLLIHDEIVYESEGRKSTDRRVLELMADTTSYKVPIIADMKGSKISWQAKEKIKL